MLFADEIVYFTAAQREIFANKAKIIVQIRLVNVSICWLNVRTADRGLQLVDLREDINCGDGSEEVFQKSNCNFSQNVLHSSLCKQQSLKHESEREPSRIDSSGQQDN